MKYFIVTLVMVMGIFGAYYFVFHVLDDPIAAPKTENSSQSAETLSENQNTETEGLPRAIQTEENLPKAAVTEVNSSAAPPAETVPPETMKTVVAHSVSPSSPSSSPSSSSSESPSDDPAGDWSLLLTNFENLLPEGYTFEKEVVEGDFVFDARAAGHLKQMLADARAAGIHPRIVSTYRTVERSEYLYNNKTQEYIQMGYSAENAAVEAAKWVAPPRQSDHNAGLAIDVVSHEYDQQYGDLMHEFENFEAFEWLSTHCSDYGFVLRYPKDKQEITKITYEPWHYRYVGIEHAKKMEEMNFCLEEYVEWLRGN